MLDIPHLFAIDTQSDCPPLEVYITKNDHTSKICQCGVNITINYPEYHKYNPSVTNKNVISNYPSRRAHNPVLDLLLPVMSGVELLLAELPYAQLADMIHPPRCANRDGPYACG